MALRYRGRVFGLYRDFPSLRLGVDTLKALSFTNRDISVLLPEQAVSDTFPAHERHGIAPKSPLAFIGGALAWLTYVRPDGEGVIAGALVTFGIAPLQAGMYENQLRNGFLLVSIRSRTTAQVDNASAVLIATGAESVIASIPARPSNDPGGKLFGSARLAETLFTC